MHTPQPETSRRAFAKLLLSAVMAAMLALPGAARAELPDTYDAFRSHYDRVATTPEGAIKAFLDAVFVYMDEATRAEGRRMLQYAIREYRDDAEWDTRPTARTFVERMKDPAQQYIFRSYAKGTSPATGYKMDPNDYEVDIAEVGEPRDTRGVSVALRSTGAERPRVIYLVQEDGDVFRINVYNTLFVGVEPPAVN